MYICLYVLYNEYSMCTMYGMAIRVYTVPCSINDNYVMLVGCRVLAD